MIAAMIPLLNPRTFGLLPKLVSPDLRSRSHSGAGMCEICGVSSTFTFARIIPDDLARTAGLTRRFGRSGTAASPWHARTAALVSGAARRRGRWSNYMADAVASACTNYSISILSDRSVY